MRERQSHLGRQSDQSDAIVALWLRRELSHAHDQTFAEPVPPELLSLLAEYTAPDTAVFPARARSHA